MRYLATPSGPSVRDAMRAGLIDTMTGPYQGNVLPEGVRWGADNGKFSKDGPRVNWLGHDRWLTWLAGQVRRYGAHLCYFAVAPDVPFSAAGTLAESLPCLSEIRDLGIPAAFAAQDGCDELGLPWDEFDVLFLAGSDEWKDGSIARDLAFEAHELGKWVHMGRVNTLRRLRLARTAGCDSADGTTLAFGPDRNLAVWRRWLAAAERVPMLTEWRAA